MLKQAFLALQVQMMKKLTKIYEPIIQNKKN